MAARKALVRFLSAGASLSQAKVMRWTLDRWANELDHNLAALRLYLQNGDDFAKG
ncbi:hypothetical protein QVM48_23055 [Pseudomonas soli]|jgi:hypothetical protein|uniref:hypothetical protein n=1 Tax=Pseudomonas soli TaxID=1306993 RepID=UPI002894053C|nr:hypothetical protein [Pseudomonas soli]MDT3717143.1 hypothetical protein [Pseudomonas soli]MDT3733922.1 hypothetical protein [Pseudomonas soli]